MPVKLGPAGVPLSCKGRTIVEGMDDIISLGLETMEVQTVRMVAPQHFEQYWQAGVLANKAGFEMNIHGPYYSELLGDKLQRNRSLAKVEAALQAAKTINARHITLHAGHYGETGRGQAANEQVASVFKGIVQRIGDIWTTGDRGAQGIIDDSKIEFLDEKIFFLRDVKIKIKIVGLDELQIPVGRSKKIINTVEASTRIDAIASAGFRISRNKILERIETGMLKLNGKTVKKATISLKVGDKLQLDNKGFIEILDLELTKRERWKIKLLRK